MLSATPYSNPRSTGTKAERISGSADRQTSRSGAAATLAVIARPARLRLDLQHHALDGDDAHRVTRVNRCRTVRARAPQRVADAYDSVRIDIGFRATHLADE